MAHQMPTAKAIKDLFEDLTRRDISVARGTPIRAGEIARTAVALYVQGGVTTAAVIGIEAGLAAALAAATSLISRAEAQGFARSGQLPSIVTKNTVDIFEDLAT